VKRNRAGLRFTFYVLRLRVLIAFAAVRVLQLVAGEKWTGPAAVVFDQTAALIAAGVEAQFAFVAGSLLAERLLPLGWARPLITHPRTPGNFLRDARRLRETVLREKFDVLHAHTTHDHALAALAARGTPARLARTIHNLRHAARGPGTGALFRRAQGIAFANTAIAGRFGAPGPVLPPVVDPERFRPGPGRADTLRRFDVPEGFVLAGTVGKIAAGRGHEEAIEAAAGVSSVALVHVGHGERMPEFQRRALRLGSESRNFWTGYQEDALPDLYRSWDTLLFTACGSDQGHRAILEAMASGLPVVALDIPGVRDLMTDGEEGVITADAKGLSSALSKLAGSRERRREMGAKARRRALAFTAEAFAEKAKKFYEGILTA
jgi:glycosyltransferase involved in cell wall biosynthesis